MNTPPDEVKLAALVRRLHPLHHVGEAPGNIFEGGGCPFVVQRELGVLLERREIALHPLQVLLGRGRAPRRNALTKNRFAAILVHEHVHRVVADGDLPVEMLEHLERLLGQPGERLGGGDEAACNKDYF